jgi:four helix bundle protein
MSFDALEVAIQTIESLRPVLRRVKEQDRSLEDQMRRAAASVGDNLSEGRLRVGRDRIHLWRIAAGSAAELHTSLRMAVAFGYVTSEEVAASLALLDRERAMLWRLTHASGSVPRADGSRDRSSP